MIDISQEDLELWRDVCIWLEKQPYNASYVVPFSGVTLTTRNIDHLRSPELYARAKKYTQQRKELGLMYWASGYGWRLHKNYRETLAKHGIEIAK